MGKDDLCTVYVLCIISSTLSVVGVISHNYIDAYAQESNQNQTMTLALRTLVQNGSPFIGNLSAPITVIDFSDFQCYLCNRFVKNTEPQINQTYIQTGKAVLPKVISLINLGNGNRTTAPISMSWDDIYLSFYQVIQ